MVVVAAALLVVEAMVDTLAARTHSDPSQQHFHPERPTFPASQRGRQLILRRVVH